MSLIKKIKTIIVGAGLASVIAVNARADPKLKLEALGEFPTTNQAIVRTKALANLPGDVSAYGFVDFYGRSSDAFYSEANIGREIYRGLGAKLEWNGGTGVDDVFRVGPNFTPRLHDRLFLDLKLYPLAVRSDGEVQPTGQFNLFGRLDLPRDFYLENWTDVNIDYRKNPERRISIQSETTLGKKIVGNLSVEGQVAYNVNVPDELQGRAGIRYEF